MFTIDHAPTALKAVSLLRDNYPGLPIIACARDLEQSAQLQQADASQVYPEAVGTSLRLGTFALQMAGAPTGNVDLLLQGVRQRDYELVRDGEQGR